MSKFEEWMEKVANLHYEATGIAPEHLSSDDWKNLYEGGYTPEEAVSEELSYWASNC